MLASGSWNGNKFRALRKAVRKFWQSRPINNASRGGAVHQLIGKFKDGTHIVEVSRIVHTGEVPLNEDGSSGIAGTYFRTRQSQQARSRSNTQKWYEHSESEIAGEQVVSVESGLTIENFIDNFVMKKKVRDESWITE